MIIPILRFPEFSGGWENKKLAEVAEKIQDGTHFSPKAFDEGNFLYLTSKNVKNGYIELSTAQFISTEAHKSIYKRCDVKKGDVLITKDGTIGQTCVNELEMEFSLLSSVAFIRPMKEFSNYFIYQLLASDIGQKEIESQIAGQALKRITLTKINNFEFSFPTLPEQQKIASFLSVVDEKLQALKKKKSLLEHYKKGVMQKIFSQELRFKDDDGSEFPEWEEKKLGDVCEIKKGEQLNKDELTNEGLYPCLNGGVNPSGFTDKFNSNENTITISEGGNSCGFVNFMKSKFWLGGHCYKIKPNTKIKLEYFYQLLKFNENKLMTLRVGSGLPNIQQKDLRNFDIVICNSLSEQTKIANFLSAIDEKINNLQIQIEKMEIWKKGLLQKMFV